MGLTFEPLGKYVRQVDERNTNIVTESVLGINIDKYFMPSVANVIGTDLSNYKLLRKGRFACNPMHVGRDGRLPVSRYTEDTPAIVSPAYFMFEIIDENEIEPEYLMLCFRRPDFDRMCWFRTDASVRGGITWDDVCALTIPVLSLPEQRKIVHDYKVITDRIELLRKMNENLEAFLAARFAQMKVAASSRAKIKLETLISFCNGKARPSTVGNIPVYGGNGILSYTDCSNAENVVLIGRVGAYCGSVYIEEQPCWVSDNAIAAKSKIVTDEYFDYFLLRSFNLYDHHVGTGQQLLTQGILNALDCPEFHEEEVQAFNKEAKSVFSHIRANNNENKALKDLSSVLLSRIAN